MILLLLSAVSRWATPQQALVVELTQEESAKAKELYQRLRAAQADWETFKVAIRDKYGPQLVKNLPEERIAQVPYGAPGGKALLLPRAWWSEGVEFSTDFRFAAAKSKD